MIRTLIVDDEPVARRRIRRLLQVEKDIEIVGECGDGRDAVWAGARPDVVLVNNDGRGDVIRCGGGRDFAVTSGEPDRRDTYIGCEEILRGRELEKRFDELPPLPGSVRVAPAPKAAGPALRQNYRHPLLSVETPAELVKLLSH